MGGGFISILDSSRAFLILAHIYALQRQLAGMDEIPVGWAEFRFE